MLHRAGRDTIVAVDSRQGRPHCHDASMPRRGAARRCTCMCRVRQPPPSPQAEPDNLDRCHGHIALCAAQPCTPLARIDGTAAAVGTRALHSSLYRPVWVCFGASPFPSHMWNIGCQHPRTPMLANVRSSGEEGASSPQRPSRVAGWQGGQGGRVSSARAAGHGHTDSLTPALAAPTGAQHSTA